MFGTEYDVIPPGLDKMEPGPMLAVILLAVEVRTLSGHDQIVVMRAHQRMASHFQARVYDDMTAVVDRMDDDDLMSAAESAAAEIRAALSLTRRATDRELEFALNLQRRLPQVWEALAAGDIDVRRAKLFAHRTTHLPIAVAQSVVERIIAHAPRLTTGQLQARIDRLCLEADPHHAQERYAHAVNDRRVVTEATDSGTANLLGLDLPPHRAAAVSRRINHLARHLNTKHESRTMDQLRADVYLDLLGGKTHTAQGGGGVHIQVDLDTLAGLSEHPGELNGYGPVIADIARQATTDHQDTEWRYTITNATGQTLSNGTTKRRPNAAQRRSVEAQDKTCIFPGCRMPAIDCDLDHRTRWVDRGETSIDNLTPLCRHDHRIKHQAGWTHQPLPNGDHQWTTKLGHTYTTSGQPP